MADGQGRWRSPPERARPRAQQRAYTRVLPDQSSATQTARLGLTSCPIPSSLGRSQTYGNCHRPVLVHPADLPDRVGADFAVRPGGGFWLGGGFPAHPAGGCLRRTVPVSCGHLRSLRPVSSARGGPRFGQPFLCPAFLPATLCRRPPAGARDPLPASGGRLAGAAGNHPRPRPRAARGNRRRR